MNGPFNARYTKIEIIEPLSIDAIVNLQIAAPCPDRPEADVTPTTEASYTSQCDTIRRSKGWNWDLIKDFGHLFERKNKLIYEKQR